MQGDSMRNGIVSGADRIYAIQGRGGKPADRLAHMLEHMDRNRAYEHARAAAGGDPDGILLGRFHERYQWYRKGWRGLPAKAYAEWLYGDVFRARGHPPLCIDLETAAVCDLACPFCYRQWVATPDKIMDERLAMGLIDQAADLGVPSMKFNWRGEPLLNPALPRLIAHAKKRGILDTLINTNATTLDETKARELIDAGLDHIIYSFDGGSAKSYNRMRPGRFHENAFDQIYANICRFARVRSDLNSPFPFTKIQMILTEETFPEQENFFQLFSNVVDDVSVKAYTERGGNLKDVDGKTRARIEDALSDKGLGDDTPYWRDADGNLMVAVGRFPCEQPYQRLLVAHDGRVSMCCYDWGVEHPVGYVDTQAIVEGDAEYANIVEKAKAGAKGFELLTNVRMPRRLNNPPKTVQTLSEIWHGASVDAVRRLHGLGRINDVAVCAHCPFKDTYRWEKVAGNDRTAD
jgi:molybdenum cofactor biosynthesis enzyme MoaA